MKKKSLCILSIMVLGIILARIAIINIAKEKYREYLENQKKILLEQAVNNVLNKSKAEEIYNDEVVDSKHTINESNNTEIKEKVEEVNVLQSNDKEISVDNNMKIEEIINSNESNNETENLSTNSSTNSNDNEIINIEKSKETSEIDYSINVGAPDGELVMSYDYLRVYLEENYISVYKNIIGTWEFHAGADIIQNPPYSWKAINSVYMVTDPRIPDDKSYELTIVTYDHKDRFRTESYIEVMLDGEIIYTQNI